MCLSDLYTIPRGFGEFVVANFLNRYVDDVLQGTNESLAIDVKFDLLKARLSGPGGNTTGADGLTRSKANATSNVNAASILMDPLNFYQVSFFTLY